MATARRRELEVIPDHENIDKRPGKAYIPTARPTIRRPALGDLGNNLHVTTAKEETFKKPEIKSHHLVPTKPTVSKSTTTSKDKVQVKVNTSGATTKVETTKNPILKRQESIVNVKSIDKSSTKSITDPVGYSSQHLAIVNPDEQGKNDPQLVYEYLPEIFSYLRDLETKMPIQENFLENHQSTPRMRTILVNWLVEVHSNFKLCLETLYLCVAIVDRYLEKNKKIGRQLLQLVGTSAMLIASKYEEMYIPPLSDFVYICDDTFTLEQILETEIDILKKLDFNLSRPLPIHFLRRYSKIGGVRPDQHNLAKYILELALLEDEMSSIKPSIQAACACCLSIAILSGAKDPSKVWTPTFVHYTTYKYSDFKTELVKFAHLIVKAKFSKNKSVYSKYLSSSYGKISESSKLQCPLITKLTNDSLKQK